MIPIFVICTLIRDRPSAPPAYNATRGADCEGGTALKLLDITKPGGG